MFKYYQQGQDTSELIPEDTPGLTPCATCQDCENFAPRYRISTLYEQLDWTVIFDDWRIFQGPALVQACNILRGQWHVAQIFKNEQMCDRLIQLSDPLIYCVCAKVKKAMPYELEGEITGKRGATVLGWFLKKPPSGNKIASILSKDRKRFFRLIKNRMTYYTDELTNTELGSFVLNAKSRINVDGTKISIAQDPKDDPRELFTGDAQASFIFSHYASKSEHHFFRWHCKPAFFYNGLLQVWTR